MIFFDSHLHYVDDGARLAKIAETSKYKDVFIGYSAFSMVQVDYESHLDQSLGCILMPACLKETKIQQANDTLKSFANQHSSKKIYYASFIDETSLSTDFPTFLGFKEHFFIHNCFEWAKREKAYKYLDSHRKLLILHCDNINRIDYVKFLRDRYPNMVIQIAHLGCFQNSSSASLLVLDELSKLPNVYFDSSAVFNEKILNYALSVAPERIIFGTDIPYIGGSNFVDRYNPVIELCNLSETVQKKIFYENAFEMISKVCGI